MTLPLERSGALVTGSRRTIELIAATFSQIGASVTQQGTIVLGVFFAATYHLRLGQMGALLSTLTLGWMVSGLIIGTLVDTYGPRRVLLVGTSVLCVLAGAIALVHSLVGTVILLFLLGLALGTVPLAGTKAVLMSWPREQRGLPMGIRQMGVPVGAMIAALALPALASQAGIYPLYLGFALLLGVSGFAFCAVLRPFDRGAGRHAAHAPRLRHEASGIAIPAASGFLLSWGQYMLLTYTIPMLHDRAGISLTLAGVILAVAQVGGALGRIIFGAISDRLGGRRDVVLLGAATASALLACGSAALPRHASLLVLVPLWLVMGITMVGWNALILTWAGERVSVGNAGAAMGFTTSAVLTGATASAPLLGLVIEVSGTYSAAWLTLAAVLAVAVVLLWSQVRRGRPRADAQTASRAAVVGR